MPLIIFISYDFGYASESSNYPKTISVLTELYVNGVTSWQQYKAYAVQANAEGYQGLASMFAAMAASQSVVTDRFGRLLIDLGGYQPTCLAYLPEVAETKANLKTAIEMEFLETDIIFPKALQQLAGEGYPKAVRSLRLILEAQRHQRIKLESIYPYTGYFFSAFTSKIEKLNPTYYICRQTGAVILNALPAYCPVRGGSTTAYIELLNFETPNMIDTCKRKDRYTPAG